MSTKVSDGVEFEGYRALAVASLTVGVFVALLSLLARLVFVAGQNTAQEIDPHWLGEVRAKVELLQEEEGLSFGLALGTSTLKQALDKTPLENVTGVPWMTMCGSGPSVVRLKRHLTPFLESDVRAEWILLGLSPYWLANKKDESLPMLPTSGSPSAFGSYAKLSRSTGQKMFFTSLGQLQLAIGARGRPAGVRGDWRFGDAKDGFADAEFWADQIEGMERSYGAFDKESYSSQNEESRALKVLLQELSSHTEHLYVILMPEHSELRAKLPHIAEQTLLKVVEDSGVSLTLLDLRVSREDRMFYDYCHLNTDGRAVFSEETAKVLSKKVRGLNGRQ